MTKPAVGYCRISTKDQSQYSLEYQERNVRAYCSQHGLDLMALFKDDGESSYTFDRPDWLALEAFIKANKNVRYLVIFDHDRFSRNLAEALFKIKELQDRYGIKVLATTDAIDTDFSDPTTFLMRAFKYMMAEGELWRIRQRTKSGMLQAALNGRYVAKAPWGYLNQRDREGKPILVIDEEKAFVVRLLFREYNRGLEIEELRRLAAQYGYKQQGRSAVQRILSNPVYAGMIRIPAHKDQPETLTRGLHQAIVSEAEYWTALHRLNTKKIVTQKAADVPLRGVLRCPCGKIMTAGNSKSHTGRYYWYYLCPVHKKNLPAVKLHRQLYEVLDTLSFPEEDLRWFAEKLSEQITQLFRQRGELVARTQKSLRETQDKIEATEERYLEGQVSKASYQKVIANLHHQRNELQKRLLELEQDQQVYWERLNHLLPQLHDVRGTFEKMDLLRRQQFLRMGFDNSLMHDGTTYRTRKLHPLFAHNVLVLKEKGLLIVEEETAIGDESPLSAPHGTPIELLSSLEQLLEYPAGGNMV